ncbi:MAG: class I SAM-dependent methyltransferase [Planctomycetota bacterium]|jgi:SAM-dependent methyltransferase
MTTPKISLDPPAPRQAMGAEYYDKVYTESANYAQDYRDMAYYPIWAQTIRLMRAIGEPRILDIGCGVGHLAHYLWDEGFRDYHGFDFSPRAVEMARERVEQDMVVADAYDLASYDFDYDIAIATEVFEHLDDDLAVVGHLKPGTRPPLHQPPRHRTPLRREGPDRQHGLHSPLVPGKRRREGTGGCGPTPECRMMNVER